jgi:hypothetical protein
MQSLISKGRILRDTETWDSMVALPTKMEQEGEGAGNSDQISAKKEEPSTETEKEGRRSKPTR